MAAIRYFQHLAGDRKNEIVIFDKIESEDEMVFICFKDGGRCNEELIIPINNTEWKGKIMAEIDHPDNPWKFKEEWKGRQEEKRSAPEQSEDGSTTYIIQPFVEGKKKITPVPPRKTQSNFGNISNHIETAAPPEPVAPPKPDNPVHLMVDKSKKFDTQIELEMTVSLPKQNLYGVINESFENGGMEMIDYMVDNIDIELFKTALKKSLMLSYSNDEDTYTSNQLVLEPEIGQTYSSTELKEEENN